MTQRLEAQGRKNGSTWDDGSDHDDVTKIFVRGDSQGIKFIQFDYIRNGQPKYGSFHGFPDQGFTQTFEINHLEDEQLESVEGYFEPKSSVIQGIQFKTNLRISELIGIEKDCSKFSLSVDGKKIIGFHGGIADKYLSCLGAYFTWISPTRLEAKGGKGGKEWTDGADHEGITKVYVHGGCDVIQYIKFDYVKDGQLIQGSIHGASYSNGFTQPFEIDHLNNEYLVSVEGYYDDEKSGIIHGLEFKTNIKTSNMIGYTKGKKFKLAANGKKIVGFHGYADKDLNSLGAYFTTTSFTKLEHNVDTINGNLWDDGAYEGVRKVYIYANESGVSCLRFDYDNRGKVKSLEHGCNTLQQEDEFVVDYPNEFITSVEGTMETDRSLVWVSSLTFKTSKGRASRIFGIKANYSTFVLESKGCALVGFHGRSYEFIRALGAYFRPLPPLPDAEELEPQGGDGGDSWDDGGFDGIRKIYIGHNELGIAFVKFLYNKDNQAVVGDDHGNKTRPRVDEFELNYPSEYLISVEGKYDVVDGSEYEVIRMLRFKTNMNMRPSQTFGLETTSKSFTLEKECHKIVGFHGRASNMLHQIGIHVLPIPTECPNLSI
ncbi:hypothetical protein AALP_AA4G039500 [Arabis alpina]|uniref:Jacalin-type lectin domain-containing protein n=1 Tax=Arabis alpina TaxID=50452 RepID=A0A087H107_ARAAL|nr:hypothetical protein AALP_AA4G039500 [Arabis alpina]